MRARWCVYCSHDADACELAAQTFQRETGHRDVDHAQGHRRVLRADPRRARQSRRPTSGTAAPSIRSCRRPSEGLLAAYRSPRVAELAAVGAAGHRAQRTIKVAAIYRIIIGFGINPRCSRRRNCRRRDCWSDLTDPAYRKDSRALQSRHERHRLHDSRHAGHALRRGRRVRLSAQASRPTSCATRNRAPRRDRRWRAAKSRVGVSFVHEFVTQQLAGFARGHRDSLRGHRRRAGRHGDHRRCAAPEGSARVLRLGADAGPAQELANRTKNLIIPANAKADDPARGRALRRRPHARRRSREVRQPRGAPAPAARWQREIGDSSR